MRGLFFKETWDVRTSLRGCATGLPGATRLGAWKVRKQGYLGVIAHAESYPSLIFKAGLAKKRCASIACIAIASIMRKDSARTLEGR